MSIIDLYIQNELTIDQRNYIENSIEQDDKSLLNSYNSIMSSRKKLLNSSDVGRSKYNNFTPVVKQIPFKRF